MKEEDKKKVQTTGANQWVQDARTTQGPTTTQSGGNHSEQTTKIDPDVLTDASFNPVKMDYTPKGFQFNADAPDGILAQISRYMKRPEFDEDRAERLRRVARVNAFGDLAKHLGAFAGGGYAPAQKREENKGVLRAFAELDKMRDQYDARSDNYNDKMAGWLMNAHNTELQKQNLDENRKMQVASQNAGYENSANDARRGVVVAAGTKRISDGSTSGNTNTNGWQNSSKNMVDKSASGSGGSGSTIDILLPGGGVARFNKGGNNRANLATMSGDIERVYPGTLPKGEPVLMKDASGDLVPALDENGAVVRKPLTDDQYWEYIAKYAKDVPDVVDRLKTLEDNQSRGGKDGRVKNGGSDVVEGRVEPSGGIPGIPASRPSPGDWNAVDGGNTPARREPNPFEGIFDK